MIKIAVLVIGVLLVISPWMIRNKMVLDRWTVADDNLAYINIPLGAELYFIHSPLLYRQIELAAQGKLTNEQRSEFKKKAIAEFWRRFEQGGGLIGYLRIRAIQLGQMWYYPAVGLLLYGKNEMHLNVAIEKRYYGNLMVRSYCLFWGIFSLFLFIIGLPFAFRLNKNSILLIVFGIFIIIPHLILVTDFRFAAPSFFLTAHIMALE